MGSTLIGEAGTAGQDTAFFTRASALVKLGLRYTKPVHFLFKEQMQLGFLKLRNDTGLTALRQDPFQQPSRRKRTFHFIPFQALC